MKPGRPKSTDPAVSHLHIRLTPSELEVIQAAADQDGASVSEWVRDTLESAAKRAKRSA